MKGLLATVYGIFITLFLGQSLAYAQLVIDKGKVDLVVTPGEKRTETLVLKNSGDTDLTVKVYMEDFVYSPPFEGTKEFFTAGTQKGSNSNWITIAPREVTLAPKAQTQVSYVVNVPQDIKSGGYQGVMIFENLPVKINNNPLVVKQDVAQAGMSFILRIGTLIFIQTEDVALKPVLDQFAFEGKHLKFKYKNAGDAVLISEVKYYFMDEEGNVVDRGDGKRSFYRRGKKRICKWT